ncbi:MAG: DsbA family protein [Patescibacteria group bacterium]
MEQGENSSDQVSELQKKARRWKALFVVIAAVVVVLLSLGVYFYVLVRKNIEIVNGGADTNQSTIAEVDSPDAPYTGSADSPVVVVEFSDFQCPYCEQAFPVVRELINFYGDRIKFEYRNFPISESHPDAQKAAEAGLCAQNQGKFWELHDKMFINQSDLSVLALKNYAKEINLDSAKFNTCLDSGAFAQRVQKDFQDGLFAGVQGTPTFFVNGQILQGVPTFADMQGAIDQLLSYYGR